MPENFDPYFDRQATLDAAGALTKVTISACEDIALLGAGVDPSTAPRGFRGVAMAPSGDLIVFGDRVRIIGTLTLPGRAVQINARVVEYAPDAAGAPPEIDVSGVAGADPAPPPVVASRAKDGTKGRGIFHALGKDEFINATPGVSGNPGKDGDQGKTGQDAGWINIRATEFSPAGSVSTLSLTARGGDGGKGQTGQQGQPGGHGGDGMDGWVGGVLGTNDVWEARDGANGGAPGANGRGGHGGFGGNGGQITVLALGTAPSLITDFAAGGKGEAGDLPNVITMLSPGEGGIGARVRPLGSTVAAVHPDGKRGGVQPAITQPPQAPPQGTEPGAGAAKIAGSAAASDVLLTASSSQLTGLLGRVRVDRLALQAPGGAPASTAALKDVSGRLQWLTALSGASPDSDAALTAIAVDVMGINAWAADPRLDAFGHERSWVPTVTLPAYRDVLENAKAGSLKLLADAEKAWHAYRDARNQAISDASQRTDAVKVGAGQISALSKQIAALSAQLALQVKEISQRAGQIDAARAIVLEHLAEYQKNVRNHVTINVDFTQYLDVLEQTAFASANPEQQTAVGVLENAKFASKIVNVSNVTGADGQSVDKKYLLSRLDVYGDKVKSLDEAYSVVGGHVNVDDAGAYKLLCTQQSLDDLLSNYETVPGAVDAEDAMDAYVREVLARNGVILDYNGAVSAYAQGVADLATLMARQKVFETDAAGVDAPAFDNYVERLYNRARSICLGDLYLASRAYRFWALRDDTALADVLGGGASGLTALSATSVANGLLGEHAEDLASDIGDLAPRKNPVVFTFDATKTKSIIRQFRTDRGAGFDGPNAFYWEFPVPVADKSATQNDNPFGGMANVRLTEVRAWLFGLGSAGGKDGAIKVHIVQQGDEQVVAPSGAVVAMTHDPVERVFEYTAAVTTPDVASIETPAIYWDQPNQKELPDHTPVGPFATWRIAVRPQDAVRTIDWKSLTEIRVEFFVKYQAFTTR